MKNASRTTRRDFAKYSVAAAATLATQYFPWSQKAFANNSANDRPRIGFIGVGGMGVYDAPDHIKLADIVAICDVDSRKAQEAKNNDKIGMGKTDVYGDYRKVFDRNDLDAVCIYTPDHSHVKIAIEALQAGKQVFCQKPLTLTLEENQLIRNACKKFDKQVFFVGTQQRSDKDRFLRAVNMVQKGLLGDIQKITIGINGSEVGGPFAKTTPPPELNWDAWLGQAPKVDYIPERCHGNFRWWYEYSGGKFTDWGAHHVDIATWAIQHDKQGMGPIEIDGTDAHHPVPFKDGYPTEDDKFNTADKFAVKCKFKNGIEMIIDSTSDNGIKFEGTKGRIFVNRGKITGKPIEENWDKDQFTDADLQKLYKGKGHEGHKENFYRTLREGGLPVSDVFSHVIAMNTCHLAAIAARLGRTIKWDPQTEKIIGDEQAAAFFSRVQRPGFEIPRV